MQMVLLCFYSFLACFGFSIVFNLRGRVLWLSALGGAVCWFFYLLMGFSGNDIFQYFIASVAISVYSEVLARVVKAPVTAFLIPGIIPMVPGGGIYYTMEYCIQGKMDQFASTGLHTIGIAGAIAIGILLVSSVFRWMHMLPRIRKKR